METKFRAWIKDENKMIYPPNNRRFISFDGECYYIIQNVVNNKKQILQHENPENIILMQYTGLKDINGKEIYEGDILQVDEKSTYGGQYKCPVKWLSYKDGKDSWAFWGVICLECVGEPIYNDKVNSLHTRGFLTRSYGSCIQLTEMTRNSFGSIEVIGNSFENPELEVKCKT